MTTSVSFISRIQLMILLIAGAATGGAILGAAESPPGLISYQGRIVVDGVNFDGLGQFKFALISGTNGPTLWSNDGTEGAGAEPQLPVPLEVSRGIYGVLLGDTQLSGMTAPITVDDFATSDVRLRVWFRATPQDAWQILTPDQRIASVGYAHVAGTVADGAITAAKLAPGAIGQAQLPASPNFTSVQVGDRLTLGPGGLWMGSVWDPLALPERFLHMGADTSDTSTYVGAGAGKDSTNGSNDGIGVGYQALQKNQGRFNVGIGSMALSEVTSGGFNTGVGHFALGANTGDDNTAVGAFALSARNGGSLPPNEHNSAFGSEALLGLRTGTGNLGLGSEALKGITNGNSNIGIGWGAGGDLRVGSGNIYVGHPGKDEESGTIRIGTPGVHSITHLAGLVSVSALALPISGFPEADGLGAILLGGAPFLHAFGGANTFLGGSAGNFSMTAGYNTGIGARALNANTSGRFNTAVGALAMDMNTVGEGNTAVAFGALGSNDSGTNNTAVGRVALRSNQSGHSNTAIGSDALYSNTSGHANTSVGASSLYATQGDQNTAVGSSALPVGIGSNNVALGSYSMYFFNSGNGNIAIGPSAGWWLRNGSDNLYLGSYGSSESADESNTIRIGNSGYHQKVHIAGIFGVTVTGGSALYIGGDGQLGTQDSSRRFKEEIRDMGDASDILDSLRPVTFRYRTDLDPARHSQYGLIAEEVHEVAPDLVVRNEKGEIQSVRYEAVNAMLLNEFQKQHRLMERQTETIRTLSSRVNELDGRIAELTVMMKRLGAERASPPAPEGVADDIPGAGHQP